MSAFLCLYLGFSLDKSPFLPEPSQHCCYLLITNLVLAYDEKTEFQWKINESLGLQHGQCKFRQVVCIHITGMLTTFPLNTFRFLRRFVANAFVFKAVLNAV